MPDRFRCIQSHHDDKFYEFWQSGLIPRGTNCKIHSGFTPVSRTDTNPLVLEPGREPATIIVGMPAGAEAAPEDFDPPTMAWPFYPTFRVPESVKTLARDIAKQPGGLARWYEQRLEKARLAEAAAKAKPKRR